MVRAELSRCRVEDPRSIDGARERKERAGCIREAGNEAARIRWGVVEIAETGRSALAAECL
jgi:hypothetical protein